MVYVLSMDGQPLMPTKRYGKARRLYKGAYIKLDELKNPVKINLVKPYEFRKGFCVV